MSHTSQRTPDRTTYERVDGKQATARIYYQAKDHAAIIEIERAGEQWAFGIDDDALAHVLESTATANRADPTVPDWVRETLLGIGIEGVA